jgi:hypothetical protein
MALVASKTLLLREYPSGAPLAFDPADVVLSSIVQLPALDTSFALEGTLMVVNALTYRIAGRPNDVLAVVLEALAIAAFATSKGESGTYTPVLTAVLPLNMTSVTPGTAVWSRVGRVVSVAFDLACTWSGGPLTSGVNISLPPAGALLGPGTGIAISQQGSPGPVNVQTPGPDALANLTTLTGFDGISWTLMFSYQIL